MSGEIMAISIINRQKRHRIDTPRIRRSTKRLLKQLGCETKEICVLLVDDEQIRVINRDYLKRDRPTNVISFAMAEGPFGHVHPEILGDIVISIETAVRDAVASGIDTMDELEFLLIHGLLHLMGYDHEKGSPTDAEKMKLRERELFFLLRHYDLE
jgi:probable rRNA maturation factor